MFAKYHLVRHPADRPVPETALGIEVLPFDEEAYAHALQSFDPPFEVEPVARIPYGGREHPMTRVRTRRARAGRRILVLAGVHGNEHAGVLALPRLLAHLADHPDAHAHVDLTLLSPVDPVGAALRSRYNAEGADINRDFRRFETREARVVRWVFEEARPDFLVSLHEGPQDGAFAFCNRHVPRALALRLLESLAASGVTLAERDYLGRRLPRPGYAPMGPVGYAMHRLWAATLGMMPTNMFADARGVPEITLETPWGRPGHERIDAQVGLLRALIAEL